ncbi:PIN domain-containing protein [Acidianus ambivalens]|uniref:PIN domain-containing protein n=1 Tax=Acidianus ambivalens TaxID=2283 RepID=A0A650CWJ9_ACIAM|nr:PIN domain-containing protein [Acidianus ambivalens]QGR22012.1 PIN domain-containing protein [Acidianus ambivalens]
MTVIDTGILVEYINESGEYHDKVKKLLEENNTLYVTPITLSEVMYVSYRIYKASGLKDANRYTREFVEWLSYKLKVTEINQDIIFEAWEIKKKYGISLPDCYVIATANYLKDKALFRKEKEILQAVNKINKEYGNILIFIDEI